jgi:ankyrin repeat protein
MSSRPACNRGAAPILGESESIDADFYHRDGVIQRGSKDIWDCSVCLTEYDCNTGYTLKCGHGFHRRCIAKWVRAPRAQADTCPHCRRPMPRSQRSELKKGTAKNLREAAAKGDLWYVKRLVNNGVLPDQADNDGRTPLYIAAQNGHQDVVKWLGGKGPDEGGADVNQAMNGGFTPLYIAAYNGHVNVVKWLGGKGPDEGGADVNQANKDGATPLFAAAVKGHLAVVKWLGGKGPDQGKADVNQATNKGETPLFIAALKGRLDVVKWVGGKGPDQGGADVNLTTNDGATPLYVAAGEGHLDVVKWLCDKTNAFYDLDKEARESVVEGAHGDVVLWLTDYAERVEHWEDADDDTEDDDTEDDDTEDEPMYTAEV